jgi:hypothetical protein
LSALHQEKRCFSLIMVSSIIEKPGYLTHHQPLLSKNSNTRIIRPNAHAYEF